MSETTYSADFFSLHQEKSISSARQIIPQVMECISPESVIDIGCGNGTWLKAWKEFGLQDITGVDGSYVNREELLINQNNFIPFDLETGYRADRKYDLVTSLEVAEHIRPEFAPVFIQSLCRLGDVILFSAAIPGQEGTYHYNEQYPGYWAQLFQQNGFAAIDCIREKIWNNDKISWWYRQNLLFFVNRDVLDKYKYINNEYLRSGGRVMSLIHPLLFEEKIRLASHYKKLLQNPVKAMGYITKKVTRKNSK